MVRQVRDTKLDSRTARAKLPAQHEPYWRKAGRALHLGYRKGPAGASWLARAYDGTRYRKKTLGTPDDLIEADGETVLTFAQANEAALAWSRSKPADLIEADVAPKAPLTIADATEAYVAYYKGRGGRDLRSIESRVRLHILPTFGKIEVAQLTQSRVEKWLFELAASARLQRPPKVAGKAKTAVRNEDDPHLVRRRQSAANRTLTVLKAILNRAFQTDDRVPTDKAWRTVRPFKAVEAARERALSEPEVTELLAATSGPFRDLCQAALLTGCRYGELAEATVGAVDLARATLFVPRSKSGHPRHVVLTDPAVSLFRRLTKGRALQDRLFMKANKEPWRASDQIRPMRAACAAAGITPAVGFHILRHSHASSLVIRGVSLQVVAKQIGHRSTIMTEKHYAHLQPSYVAEQIKGALPNFE